MYQRIGIIREGKNPPDRRVALTPQHCAELLARGIDVTVQTSPHRAYTDAEYTAAGVPVVEDMGDRDLLIGVKEVPVDQLIADKAYLFFSHTIKKQAHNRKLLRAVLEKNITLLDHELLTNPKGQRVVAFGNWAGVVGAYNGLRALQRTWQPDAEPLKPAHLCHDRAEMDAQLPNFSLPANLRVVLTGAGRVGGGAMETLERAGLVRIDTTTFLSGGGNGPAYTVCDVDDIYVREDGKPFDRAAFYADPSGHHCEFLPFARTADLYIACHFWDSRGPKILDRNALRDADLRLSAIADVSCDIDGPIDSTLRASTIEEPFYGYDRSTGKEVATGTAGSLTIMAVDNLPCELPRDSSSSFGNDHLAHVIGNLTGPDPDGMAERATIAKGGKLTARYSYLQDYVDGPLKPASSH